MWQAMAQSPSAIIGALLRLSIRLFLVQARLSRLPRSIPLACARGPQRCRDRRLIVETVAPDPDPGGPVGGRVDRPLRRLPASVTLAAYLLVGLRPPLAAGSTRSRIDGCRSWPRVLQGIGFGRRPARRCRLCRGWSCARRASRCPLPAVAQPDVRRPAAAVDPRPDAALSACSTSGDHGRGVRCWSHAVSPSRLAPRPDGPARSATRGAWLGLSAWRGVVGAPLVIVLLFAAHWGPWSSPTCLSARRRPAQISGCSSSPTASVPAGAPCRQAGWPTMAPLARSCSASPSRFAGVGPAAVAADDVIVACRGALTGAPAPA